MGKKKFYAVRSGRQTGIFTSWDDCKRQTDGYSKAEYKSFKSQEEAQQFISGGKSENQCAATSTATSIPQQLPPSSKATSQKRDHPEDRPERKTNSADLPNPKRTKQSRNGEITSNFFGGNNSQQHNTKEVTLYFDGGSRGNGSCKQPISGSGAVIKVGFDREGNGGTKVMREICLRKFLDCKEMPANSMTNNYAEYTALLIGLQEVEKRSPDWIGNDNSNVGIFGNNRKSKVLKVRGDSNLVINQVTGNWACRSKNLQTLHKETRNILSNLIVKFGWSIDIKHVYRNDNKEADALANEAMDEKRSWITTTSSTLSEESTAVTSSGKDIFV